MNKSPLFLKIIFLGSWIAALGSFFSGCIRLVGTAGYTKYGSEDEAPKTKSVTLDTQKIVPGSSSQSSSGSVDIPAQ